VDWQAANSSTMKTRSNPIDGRCDMKNLRDSTRIPQTPWTSSSFRPNRQKTVGIWLER
jgi:hypothetical protein